MEILSHNFYDDSDPYFMDKNGRKFMKPNRYGYNQWVNKNYSNYKLSDSIRTADEENINMLLPHQAFIKEFMSLGSPYRGCGIIHGLGSGKTRTAIEISEPYREKGYKIVFISPASLADNMVEELGKWGNDDVKNIKSSVDRKKYLEKTSYTFISSNGTPINNVLRTRLENCIVIIDEAHNLGSMMANKQNKKATAFYKWLMNVKNCKIIALTGSPIINDPFEIALIANVLRGPMDYETSIVNESSIIDYKTVFPEDREEFYKLFINDDNDGIKNELMFKLRITGLFSYFYGVIGTQLPNIEIEEVYVPMSEYQYNAYVKARDYENKIDKMNYNKSDKEDSIVVSTYRNYSRQLSNFVPPPPLEEEVQIYELLIPSYEVSDWSKKQQKDLMNSFENKDDYLRFLEEFDAMDSEDVKAKALSHIPSLVQVQTVKVDKKESGIKMLKSLMTDTSYLRDPEQKFIKHIGTYSPKIKKILVNMKIGNGNKGKIFIYSHYKSYAGIEVLKSIFKRLGYQEINESNINTINVDTISAKPRYGYFIGGMKNETRHKIKQFFNHPRNIHGELMKIFMGSSAAAEGITLKQVQQVHIMEPYWNNIRIQQVIGRARRLGSHIGLPENEQTVYVYKYYSVFADDQEKIEHVTTDIAINNSALKKEKLVNEFLRVIKTSAIDCTLNYAQNSLIEKDYVCYVPSSNKLKHEISWYSNIQDDINSVGQVNYKPVIETNKYIDYPRPYHIAIFKKYNQQLYESRDNFVAGTIEKIFGNNIVFNVQSKILNVDDYYNDYYIHFFTQVQHGRIIKSYNASKKIFELNNLDHDKLSVGTKFWVYRTKYIARIINGTIEKDDQNNILLYDRNALKTENQWVKRFSITISEDEKSAIII